MSKAFPDPNDLFDKEKDYHVKITNLQKVFPITRPSLFNKKIENYIALDKINLDIEKNTFVCLLYTSPSPRDSCASRMPSSA